MVGAGWGPRRQHSQVGHFADHFPLCSVWRRSSPEAAQHSGALGGCTHVSFFRLGREQGRHGAGLCTSPQLSCMRLSCMRLSCMRWSCIRVHFARVPSGRKVCGNMPYFGSSKADDMDRNVDVRTELLPEGPQTAPP